MALTFEQLTSFLRSAEIRYLLVPDQPAVALGMTNTLMIVNLVSPDGRYDDLFLSNYATIDVRDELSRLPGVGDVSYLGQRDYSLRVWLDANKLAALNLSAMDVVTILNAEPGM